MRECFRWKATGQCSCRRMHLPHATFSHAQSLHSTDDMCAWLKFVLLTTCALGSSHSSTRHVSSCASQYTEHQHKFSLTYLSCAAVFYLSDPDLLSTHPFTHCKDPLQDGISTEHQSSTGYAPPSSDLEDEKLRKMLASSILMYQGILMQRVRRSERQMHNEHKRLLFKTRKLCVKFFSRS